VISARFFEDKRRGFLGAKSWRRYCGGHIMLSTCLSVRPSVRSSLNKLVIVNTIFWKQMNRFRCKLIQKKTLEVLSLLRPIVQCPISAKFCTRKQNGVPTQATSQKLQIFTIHDGGRPPFWKSFNHHISMKKNYKILTKCGVLQQILDLVRYWKALSQYLRCIDVMINRGRN